MLFQRATIYTNAHRTAVITRSFDNFAHTLFITDITGIDPQASGPSLGRLNGAAVMKMNIGNNRHWAICADGFQCGCAVLIGAGYAHKIGASCRRLFDLRQGARNITGQRIGHGLH